MRVKDGAASGDLALAAGVPEMFGAQPRF